MNAILEYINITGHWFVEHAFAVLIQSSLLIVILLLADLLLRRKVRAVFRYWIWMLVLAKLILPGSLTSPVSLGHLVGDRLQLVNIAAIEEKTRAKQSQSQTTPPLLIWPMTEKLTNTTAGSSLPFTEPFLGTTDPIAESVVARSVHTPTAPAIFTTTMVALTWQGIIFVTWLIVVLTMALLVLQRAMFIKGLVRQASAANRLMNEELQYCRERMRVRCKVDLKVSVNATSPAVCGLFRPVILLPRNLGPTLGSSHLRTVLMHELAHVKRGDLWINMLQAALQIVYFYNPLLWFANAIIRRVREQAVDETVLVAMGPRAQQYPETLLNVARLAFARPALSLMIDWCC